MIIMQKMMEQSHIKVFKIIAEKEYASRDKSSVCWRKSLFAESLVIVLNTLTPPDLPGPALARSVCFQQTQYFTFPTRNCLGWSLTPLWTGGVWIIPGIWVHLEIMQHTVPQCPSVKENFTESGQTGETGPLGLARLLPGVFIGETEFEWQCQLSELKAVLGIKTLLWPH